MYQVAVLKRFPEAFCFSLLVSCFFMFSLVSNTWGTATLALVFVSGMVFVELIAVRLLRETNQEERTLTVFGNGMVGTFLSGIFIPGLILLGFLPISQNVSTPPLISEFSLAYCLVFSVGFLLVFQGLLRREQQNRPPSILKKIHFYMASFVVASFLCFVIHGVYLTFQGIHSFPSQYILTIGYLTPCFFLVLMMRTQSLFKTSETFVSDVIVFSLRMFRMVSYTCFLSVLLWGLLYGFILGILTLISTKIWEFQSEAITTFCFTLFWPILLLKQIPVNPKESLSPVTENNLKSLIDFILVPCWALYTLLIYAYGILLFRQGYIPSGTVGNLIFIYLLISSLTFFLSLSLKCERAVYIKWFHELFFFILLLPLVLLGFALFKRIDAYGLTISRGWIAVFLLWMSSGLFLSQRMLLKAIPILLVIFSLFPFPIVSLSIQSQGNRLVRLLEHHQMIDSFTWKVTKTHLSPSQKKEISAPFSYLYQKFKLSKFQESFDRERELDLKEIEKLMTSP